MHIDTGLTFREIVMNEPLPKGIIQQAVLDFLKDRQDAAIFGAMAVNAYIDERRMTEDVDIVSPRAKELAEELRIHLNERFHIAVPVRAVRGGIGFRLYQLAKPKNRHLVDVRPDSLPAVERIDGILVVSPPEIIAGKVMSCLRRMGKPKSFTDRRDLAHMLLKFPEFKVADGEIERLLRARDVGEDVLAFWRQIVAEEIVAEEDDEEFF